jgi:hypothetical protein
MGFEKILGVSQVTFFLVALFWISVAIGTLGIHLLDSPLVAVIIAFLTIATSSLIGSMGWQVLILPSIIILCITAAVYLKNRGRL